MIARVERVGEHTRGSAVNVKEEGKPVAVVSGRDREDALDLQPVTALPLDQPGLAQRQIVFDPRVGVGELNPR